jgi:hypothetical protein
MKQERSRRMVKLQNWVMAVLRRLKEETRTAEAKSGNLIFTIQRIGKIHETKFIERHFKPLLQSGAIINRGSGDLSVDPDRRLRRGLFGTAPAFCGLASS